MGFFLNLFLTDSYWDFAGSKPDSMQKAAQAWAPNNSFRLHTHKSIRLNTLNMQPQITTIKRSFPAEYSFHCHRLRSPPFVPTACGCWNTLPSFVSNDVYRNPFFLNLMLLLHLLLLYLRRPFHSLCPHFILHVLSFLLFPSVLLFFPFCIFYFLPKVSI